ncbi:hypothetical protein HMPREF0731_4413 [Pseudoroseomonas cervicalis ATCC 49957]|uniref:Uncharacterized protein n=1 Tax=Pseudoroseomonas cervicalis ATCC 49957 TaxID=525371 RepID=D5RTK1_9PROT|nr:hypothetical protein HMPREF0731_4413 [Pseudoroseomonas cervicalis ATCC 49957]
MEKRTKKLFPVGGAPLLPAPRPFAASRFAARRRQPDRKLMRVKEGGGGWA